jgi:outer membrane protein assembly factor BamA
MKDFCAYHFLIAIFLFCFPGLRAQEIGYKTPVAGMAVKESAITIRDIHLTGNKITKKFIVLREVLLIKDSSYTITQILENIKTSRQNLMNTALFVDATVNFSKWENDSIDIIVDVKERWYYWPAPVFRPVDRNWNVWINQYKVSFERVNYGIKFQGKNVTGMNDRINITLLNGYARTIAVNYFNPYIDKKLRHGLGVDFAYSKAREVNYSTRKNVQSFYKDESKFIREQLYVGLAYSYRKGSVVRHTARLGLVIDNVDDTVINLNPKFFSTSSNTNRYPEFQYRYQYLGVNYIPYPTKGYTLDFSFLKKGFGGPMNLWQFNAKAYKHWTLPYKFYYSIGGEVSLKLPFDQPFINMPFLGYGDAYLRGMEYYVVDGVAGGFIRNTVRKEVASVKLKTGIKSRIYGVIPFRFYLKGYADVGYVHNKFNTTGNIFSNKVLYTSGFGLDILTIYDIVLRFEYSFNQLNERAFFFHKNDF